MRAIASQCGSDCCHDEFICCGREMDAVGFTFGNGWECPICGHREFDVASFKMGGHYEQYLLMGDNDKAQLRSENATAVESAQRLIVTRG